MHMSMEYLSLMVPPVIASTFGRAGSRITEHDCPYNNNSNAQIHHFMGNDYYCESGTNNVTDFDILYNTDHLWDGQVCTAG